MKLGNYPRKDFASYKIMYNDVDVQYAPKSQLETGPLSTCGHVSHLKVCAIICRCQRAKAATNDPELAVI